MFLSTEYFSHFVDLSCCKFRGSNITSFIYSFKRSKISTIDQLKRELVNLLDDTVIDEKKKQDILFSKSNLQWIRNNHQEYNCRDLLLFGAIDACQKSNDKIPLSLLKELCIYMVLMEDLPVQERSFDLVNSVPLIYHPIIFKNLEYLSKIVKYFIPLLLEIRSLKGQQLFNVDLLDGKFLIFISLLIQRYKITEILDQNQMERLHSKIGDLGQLIDQNIDLQFKDQSSITPEIAVEVLDSISKQTQLNNSIEFPKYQIDSDFVREVVGDVQDQLEFQEDDSIFADFEEENEYFAVSHTHVISLLKNLPDAFQTKLREEWVAKKKYSEKAKQGAAAKYFRNSESLFDPSKKTLITELYSAQVEQKKEKVNYQVTKQTMKNLQLKKKDAVKVKLDDKLKQQKEYIGRLVRKHNDVLAIIKVLQSEIPQYPQQEFIKVYQIALDKIFENYQSENPQHRLSLYQLIQQILRLFDSGYFVYNTKDEYIPKFVDSMYHCSTKLELFDLSDYIDQRFQLTYGNYDPSFDQNHSSVCYQMKHSHDTLVRSTGSSKDPRVKHFEPDDWQKSLLDIVDRNESALICAPTSSGKTFISFYCFEKILRESNDGIVVYVSPTKALVNQMYAEVIGRYEKNYVNIVGNDRAAKYRMAGIFTRDYRVDYDKCQVLITVPQCLDLLFLSITSSDWLHKVKYVIFDEVHLISSEPIWEQLLLINPAPFLALSATIGNLEEFHHWLKEINPERKVELIKTENRFNDLKFYQYNHSDSTIVPHHPFSTLKMKKDTSSLNLLSEESLELYNVMVKRFGGNDPEISYLDPLKFFSKTKNKEYNLKKEQLKDYQNLLKQVFNKRLSHPGADSIIHVDFPDLGLKGEKNWKRDIPKFIEQLKEQNLLPAIVFFFSRDGCEKLAQAVKHSIDRKNYDPKRQSKIRVLQSEIDKLKEEIRVCKPSTDDEIFEELDRLCSQLALLTNRKPEYGTIMREDIYDPKNKLENHHLMGALMEGVAVHHSGLQKEYVENVEILFRKKKIQVAFATSSLALGVNLPCKTVVIAGESPYNNPLMFRQMSGRAGRRGYEPRGHVISLGLSENRMNSLVNSKLSNILGNTVLTPSLVLRLFCRFNFIQFEDKSKQEEYSQTLINCTKRILEKSFYLTNEPLQNQLLFLFSTDYIYRNGYLNPRGQAIGYSGIITHLSYLEPVNFIFVDLIRAGVFEKFTGDNKYDEVEILKILAFLFCRENLPNIIPMRSSSLISLPELPEYLAKVYQENNMKLVKTLVPYLLSMQDITGSQDLMPLSKDLSNQLTITRPISNNWKNIHNKFIEDPKLIKGVKSLLGSTNNISSLKKLEYSLPLDSYMDFNTLPLIHHEPSRTNSYLVDFYKHKQLKTIIKDNRIKDGNIFTNLKDFVMTLKTISAALQIQDPDKPVTLAFVRLSQKYIELFKNNYN
ncbi:putative RNA helicase of the SKI2 subfamily [Tieghemostelium lacteum]|uniref:Putative RNA helicase of the SKI2 subfamily n=1 Tax=Tieghemostelium lacteum TaxID=361077 RepID=A0A151ZGS8_TIELA|nr:putative RNA helicase of the SKI2 subfamily [Tieghemostelium lacteum]|eukprot:KYQ93080.1 putative RNA helicase of the SKI2 subfamily [Tieghemostelium lacteum]